MRVFLRQAKKVLDEKGVVEKRINITEDASTAL